MASVTKRGKTWSVRYRVFDALGNETMKRVSGYPTKEAAWEDARRLEAASNAGVDVHGDRQSIGFIIERWYSEHVLASTAITTAAKYRYMCDIIAEYPIYNMPVRKLSPLAYTKLLDKLRERRPGKLLAPTTVLSYADPIRLSLSWAVAQGILARNPILGYRWNGAKNHVAARHRILNDADVAALEKASRGKLIRIPLLLALYGGLRREEVAALKWDAVEFERNAVYIVAATTTTITGAIVEKSVKSAASARHITLPAFVMDELRIAYDRARKLGEIGHVAAKMTGERYSLYSYGKGVSRLAESINAERESKDEPLMPVPTFHGLRHTHAAMLIRNGVQPKIIQERLGHASIKITMDTYGYLMAGLQEGVGEILDIYHSSISVK